MRICVRSRNTQFTLTVTFATRAGTWFAEKNIEIYVSAACCLQTYSILFLAIGKIRIIFEPVSGAFARPGKPIGTVSSWITFCLRSNLVPIAINIQGVPLFFCTDRHARKVGPNQKQPSCLFVCLFFIAATPLTF